MNRVSMGKSPINQLGFNEKVTYNIVYLHIVFTYKPRITNNSHAKKPYMEHWHINGEFVPFKLVIFHRYLLVNVSKNYGKIHPVKWENSLFRLGHFR